MTNVSDKVVAERILERIRQDNLLCDEGISELQQGLSKGQVTPDEWRLMANKAVQKEELECHDSEDSEHNS